MNKHDDKTHNQQAADRSVRRIKELMQQGLSQSEMVATLNAEGYRTIRLRPWSVTNLRQILWRIRHDLRSWYGLSSSRCGLQASQV
jgi:uncharacterized protein YoaH (UPF0181 family)